MNIQSYSDGREGTFSSGEACFFLNSSHICSIVTHSTPSCLLMCSINLMTVSRTRGHSQPYRRMVCLPFVHEKHMRSARNIRMNRDGKDANLIWIVRHIPVEIIEVVPPQVFDISRIDPSVTIGRILDEHHGRQAVVALSVWPISRFRALRNSLRQC